MNPIFDKTHANISRYGYLCCIGLALISLILLQFRVEQWYVISLGIFGISMSLVSLFGYIFHFFRNLKLFYRCKWLFIGNILFIGSVFSSFILFYFFRHRGIRELILVVSATLLFLLISKQTCRILMKRSNTELIR